MAVHRRRLPPSASLVSAALAATVIHASCGDAPEPGAVARDSAGVRILELPPVVPGRDELAVVPLLPPPGERRGGDPDTREDGDLLEFSAIAAVDAAPDGTLYVLDRLAGSVTLVDPSAGTARGRFGRRGDGPGEFRSAAALALLEDGGVLVGERVPPRLHLFRRDGTLVSSSRLRPGEGDGSTPGFPAGPAMADWRWPVGGTITVRVLTLPADPHEPPTNRLFRADLTGRLGTPLLEWTEPGSLAEPPVIFTERRSWSPGAAGGLHYSDGRSYEVRTLSGDGSLRRVLRRPHTRRPVTPDERERALETYRDAMSAGGAAAELVDRVASRLRVADRLPAIQTLWTDRGTGDLWVGIPGVDAGTGDLTAAELHLYDPEGAFLGRLTAPDGFRLLTVRDRVLYGSVSDELGIPHLRAYRVVGDVGEAPARH